jgi:signal transduction histidine kinase
MRILAASIGLLLSAVSALVCEAEDFPPRQSDVNFIARSGHCITNVAQFRILSGVDFLAGCDFHLTGVVTLVDTNRDLVVLQDATGGVALNFRIEDQKLQVGQLVTLEGTNCCPYFASFPDYPYSPSGWNICGSFEAPMNWGEYTLTRMRGYLHPQVTGEYRFWVASDNSSELWLSTDTDPSEIREIASVPRFGYVNPDEWSRYPSQSSEPIELKAGTTYYIEALQEQTTGGQNLSVAWQGPGLRRSVIDGRYLTPWNEDGRPGSVATNGILREYWTNYSAGDLTGMGGARTFESILTVEKVWIHVHGQGELPKADPIVLNRPLRVENNYRWVRAEGVVKFKATDGNAARLELSDGRALVEVRVEYWSPEMSKQLRQLSNAVVRIEGVCEGVYDQNETLIPGLIWASAKDSISLVETATTNKITAAGNQFSTSTTTTNPARQGFYQIRGVVTFNDRALGTDYIFVQAADATAVRVTLDDQLLKSHLKAGEWADLGGALEPGKYLPVLTPLYVAELGRHSMPSPVTQSLGTPATANPEGDWSEIEGVVHSVNTNGTLSIAGKDGPAYLWLGQTSSNSLADYVDAKLRARGVLMLHLLDAPVLLIPSRDFVDVEEEASKDPFGIRGRLISDLLSESTESSQSHRVRVVGEVTYRDTQSFFIQDASGGIRVRTANEPTVKTGETIEVLAFPTLNGSVNMLTEALVRPAKSIEHVGSKDLDLSEALSSKQSGTLVHASATLLGQSTNESGQVLELQELQRVFVATLATGQGNMPDIAPGSRLQITGVCDNETTAELQPGEKPASAQTLASLNILLRSPRDVTVISGPPWWTWKRTVTLVGTLLTVLLVTLLWVHLLHRRLERQQAAQLAFSRQVLERLEDERRRIAINLHDSLGQVLLAIKNQALLAIQRPLDEAGLRQRLEEISGASSQAIEEVRQITYGLRPYQLDRLGLTQAIRAAVGLAAESGSILFASRVEGIDNVFDKDSEIHVYRIVQEAINNVIKHSAATEATVVIKRRPGVVSLSIRDNGRGFAMGGPGSANPSSIGSGLSGIAERVRILNGTLAVDSWPGEGTNLTIEVALPTDANETGSNSIHRG